MYGFLWGFFYIALYPVHWTAQSALHFPPLADLFIPTPFSASLGSILAMQQLRNDYSLTFPPLSIARYSFIQLSRLRRREVKENAQTSKRYQRGFEPGLSRLRVRHSTTEPPRSTRHIVFCGTIQAYCMSTNVEPEARWRHSKTDSVMWHPPGILHVHEC